MRVVLVGASPLAVLAVKSLREHGHEVVLIDQDPDKIERLSDTLDCGLVTGDGSRPSILEDVGPEQTDFLFCLSDRDESNILAALVGRSLGFERVVPKLEDPDLEPICTELGLDEAIVPDHQVATLLTDLVERDSSTEIKALVRGGLRFFVFQVPEGVAVAADLELPSGTRLLARNRDDSSVLAEDDLELEEGDEVVLIAEEDRIDELRQRFGSPRGAGRDD